MGWGDFTLFPNLYNSVFPDGGKKYILVSSLIKPLNLWCLFFQVEDQSGMLKVSLKELDTIWREDIDVLNMFRHIKDIIIFKNRSYNLMPFYIIPSQTL